MSTMLLQKPVPISFATTAPYSHRRHPSAPVVVQPTHTPGLLSIKHHKPTNTNNRHLPSNQRINVKVDAPRPSKPAPVVRAQPLTPAPHIADRKPMAAPPRSPETPTPQSRGRSQAKHTKDNKTTTHRSASSHSPLRGKHGRQPSPPIATTNQVQLQQTPSQAEATVISTIKSSNLFDPFADATIPNAYLNSPPPSPTLARPSGKLARRREQATFPSPPSPVRSKAIPVPTNNNKRTKHTPTLSRSEPAPSHIVQRPRPIPQRSTTFQDFPICNDDADEGPLSPPSTPIRTRAPAYTGGAPRTAPQLAARPVAFFPFTTTPPPMGNIKKPTTNPRKHRRVPSEGVFHMSSDEDVASTASSSSANLSSAPVLNANVQALFGLVSTPTPSKRMSSPPAYANSYNSFFSTPGPYGAAQRENREQQLEREASEKAGYFASSMFQNSPSPEELPDPLLL